MWWHKVYIKIFLIRTNVLGKKCKLLFDRQTDSVIYSMTTFPSNIDWQKNHDYEGLGIWQIISKKISTQWSCHFKNDNWMLLLMIKFVLSRKSWGLDKLYHLSWAWHFHSDGTDDGISECGLSIFPKVHQHFQTQATCFFQMANVCYKGFQNHSQVKSPL